MSTISIGANRALDDLIDNGGRSDFAHLYLVFTDDDNNRYVTSLNDVDVDPLRVTRGDWPVVWNLTQINTPWEETDEFVDFQNSFDPFAPPVDPGSPPVDPSPRTNLRAVEIPLDLGSRDAGEVWNIITQVAQEFRAHTIDYRFVESNSNSFVSALLEAVGIEVAEVLPPFLPEVGVTSATASGIFPVAIIPDPFIQASGHKFTGIFGARSATAFLDPSPPGAVPGAPFPIGGSVVPEDGIFHFDFRLVGTGSGDVIRGVRGDDVFLGMRGEDLLLGGGGDDILAGGGDNDQIDGGAGEDVLRGGPGDDELRGGPGRADELDGGSGRDVFTVVRGEGGKVIPTFDRGDQINLVGFNEVELDSNKDGRLSDADARVEFVPTVRGILEVNLGGSDSVSVHGVSSLSLESTQVPGIPPAEPLRIPPDVVFTIFGTNGADNLTGTDKEDIIFGLGGDDTLNGGENDDLLDGGSGRDRLDGGPGDDRMFGAEDNESGRLPGGIRPGLFGREGDDELDGGAGIDLLDGGADDDRLEGGDNDDRQVRTIETPPPEFGEPTFILSVQGGLFGGIGDDELSGGAGSDTLVGGEGDDTLRGGDGDDGFTRTPLPPRTETRLDEQGNEIEIEIDILQEVLAGLDGGPGSDVLEGGKGDDTLVGDTGGDSLSGEDGNDTLDGGTDGDGLSGGAGNDTLDGGAGLDGLHGGAGNDTLDGGGGDAERDILIGAGDRDSFNYDAAGGGPDRINDFRAGDGIFVRGVLEGDIDTADPQDDVIDANDTPVSVIDSNLVIDFDGGNSLTVIGVTQLAVNADIFFV